MRPAPAAFAGLWTACKAGSPVARAALIEAHVRYAELTVAHRHGRENAAWGDLVGEALLALVKAVDRFEPERGVAFVPYLIRNIRFALAEYFRRQDWVPRSARREALADPAVVVYRMVSLEGALAGEVAGRAAIEAVPDPAPDAYAQVTGGRAARYARMLAGGLNGRERRIVRARYWEETGWRAIAEAEGLSESQVLKLHDRALLRCRALYRREAGDG